MSQKKPRPRNNNLRRSVAMRLSMPYTNQDLHEKRMKDEEYMRRVKEELGPDKPRIIMSSRDGVIVINDE